MTHCVFEAVLVGQGCGLWPGNSCSSPTSSSISFVGRGITAHVSLHLEGDVADLEPSHVPPSPAVAGGVVFVASMDGNVYALK